MFINKNYNKIIEEIPHLKSHRNWAEQSKAKDAKLNKRISTSPTFNF